MKLVGRVPRERLAQGEMVRLDWPPFHLVEPRGLCDDQRVYVARFDGSDVVVWDPGPPVTIVGG